jgi:predicted Zn finger-like uncharacterized protein
MIVSCPSCATRYDLSASHFAAEGTMIKCSACGHSWLEGRAVEVIDVSPNRLPAVIDHHGFEPDREVRRLVEASREARESFAANRRKRRAQLKRWAGLAAALALPIVIAGLFPEFVVRAAPASVQAYERLGIDVNIYGLVLRRVEQTHTIEAGTRVLSIKGEIVNVSGRERKIPWLRFALHDDADAEVYRWVLDSAARPLRPGESTSFVTRVAAPPETAKNLEIRFAHANEIGSNAAP